MFVCLWVRLAYYTASAQCIDSEFFFHFDLGLCLVSSGLGFVLFFRSWSGLKNLVLFTTLVYRVTHHIPSEWGQRLENFYVLLSLNLVFCSALVTDL